ncbi:MAG TPA: hypothetical protein VF365_10805 [Candidatus Limnocylindria bacterium]
MSLFRGTIRPPAVLSDEAVERNLAAIRAELQPDPLFRRRLRGEVMNRYVAAREGIGATPRRRSMGALGRAVLYATFTLAVTSTSVLAASQEALPGDLLYPLKRHVEVLRVQVLPGHLHDDLAALALAERISELGHLAERGDWGRVAIQAAAVQHDYDVFLALVDAAPPGSNERYLTVLAGLVERLPDPARSAVEGAIDRRSGADPTRSVPRGPDGDPPRGNGGSTPAGGAAGGSSADGDGVDATAEPKPTKSPRPNPTPRASRAPDGAADDGGTDEVDGEQ